MIDKLSKEDIKALSDIAGHEFNNIELLSIACSHSSVFSRNPEAIQEFSYERLEFLGDRVLGLIVSQLLYEKFPSAKEGELSKRFNALVNSDICAKITQKTGLKSFIRTSDELHKTNTNAYHNIYADVMEAFIAVIYLDGGLDKAKKFVNKYWLPLSDKKHLMRLDAKTSLQEWAHKYCGRHPEYNVINVEGPAHEPLYHVEVSICGLPPEVGTGTSKRKAQIDAATKMLYQEGIWQDESIE